MHLIALLILPALVGAEPVPNLSEKPAVESHDVLDHVELKLSSAHSTTVEITIQNKGQEPLEVPYRVTPLELFVVEMKGENGKQCQIEHGKRTGPAEPGILTIPAGKSKTLSVHACHYYPALGDLDQKVTFIARLKYAGQTLESKPLTLDP